MMKLHLLIFSILLFPCFELSAQNTNTTKKREIPNVELNTLKGEKVNIQDYLENGKISVFNFWATWCAPCKQELNNISAIYADWQKDYNMELIAVSLDEAKNIERVKSFQSDNNWPFAVLLDPDRILQKALNFQMPPYTVLTNEKGEIVSLHSGYKVGDEYILEEKLKALSK